MRHGRSARPKPEDTGGIEAQPALTRAKMMMHNCISIAAATLFLPSPGSRSMPGWWGPGAFLAVAVFDQVQSGAVGTQHVLPEGFWQHLCRCPEVAGLPEQREEQCCGRGCPEGRDRQQITPASPAVGDEQQSGNCCSSFPLEIQDSFKLWKPQHVQ